MRRLPTILCCHCGRDYTREYWALGAAADPNVCKSCRRDTNPDAADAPRGGPPSVVPDDSTMPPIELTHVRKQCRVCGGGYDGLIFGPSAGQHPSKDAPLPFGICPRCGLAEDRAMTLATAPIVPYAVPARSRE